ncbi:HNH endonuclease signature motif containing protein [Amorphus sp. MBR-141]
MFVLVNGPLPPRKQVDHRCNRRLCVNPDHLEMVTHLENQRRRDRRRASQESDHGNDSQDDRRGGGGCARGGLLELRIAASPAE